MWRKTVGGAILTWTTTNELTGLTIKCKTGILIGYDTATLVFQAREDNEYQMNFYLEILWNLKMTTTMEPAKFIK
jgi:hypothetical protein